MSVMRWQVIPSQWQDGQWGHDELLVVIPAAGSAVPATCTALREQAFPALQSRSHYLTVHAGFLGKSGKNSPYLLAEWTGAANVSLERRWVFNHMVKVLKGRPQIRKLHLYLAGPTVTPEQMVLAEDIYFQFQNPLYTESKLQDVGIWYDQGAKIPDDGYRDLRLRGQADFRRWVNDNPDSLTSVVIGERLEKFAKEHNCGFKVFERAELQKENLNLLLAVGQASERSPSRLIMTTHNYQPGCKPLMMVGKGITFDTGGINLKPHESYVNCMKNDMGGAGLSANLFMALVRAGYKEPLVLLIPTCENLIDAQAMKPGAIYQTRSGKSVIIEHTDAEGRLILSDAISYGEETFQPALTMSFATLTTGALRQFSHFFTAVHFAPAALERALTQSSETWGERFTFWGEFLPFLAANQSRAASLTNMGRMPEASSMSSHSNVAAHFLKQFTKNAFVHFDIFASTWNWGGDYPGAHYGATGAPFNSLFDCLRQTPSNLWGSR